MKLERSLTLMSLLAGVDVVCSGDRGQLSSLISPYEDVPKEDEAVINCEANKIIVDRKPYAKDFLTLLCGL
jgi:hypothetical protein